MLNTANAGIQLMNKSVPLIISDATIGSFKDYSDLHFIISLRLIKNVHRAGLVYLTFLSTFCFVSVAAFFSSNNTQMIYNPQMILLLTAQPLLDLGLMIVFNDSVDSRIVERYPIVSREVSFLKQNFMYDLSLVMAIGFLEAAVVFYLIYRFVANDYETVGYQSSIEIEAMMVTVILLINHKIRVLLNYSKWSIKSILVNCVSAAVSTGLIIFALGSTNQEILNVITFR